MMKRIILLLMIIGIFSGCFNRQRPPEQIRQVKEKMDEYQQQSLQRVKDIEEATEEVNQQVREFRNLIWTNEVTVEDLERFRETYRKLEQVQNHHIYKQDEYIRKLENLAGGLLDPKERFIQQRYSVFERGLK